MAKWACRTGKRSSGKNSLVEKRKGGFGRGEIVDLGNENPSDKLQIVCDVGQENKQQKFSRAGPGKQTDRHQMASGFTLIDVFVI